MQMIKKTQESKPREYNYELLRVLSCIGIISIHVASFYSNFFISEYKVNNISYDFFYIPAFMTCVYESLGRFGVGCFLMLSGAFILNSVKTRDYREFYRHRLYKLGIPTILFSVLLVFYQSMFVDGGGIVPILKKALTGAPMYHMWYMYMFMIVMLLTPILYRFKESIDKKTFIKVSWVFFIFACFSRWNTHDVRLEYDLGQGFEYLSFLMLGFCVREKSDYSLKKMGAYLLLGIILLLGVAVIEYEYMICGISESSLRYKFSQPYCPLVAIATFCIFKAFSLLYIKGKWILLQRISSLTFYIYLWHAAIWDFLHRNNLLYSGSDVVNENIIWRIPLYVLVVFILSTILSLFTKTFSRMIKLKYIQ